MDRNEAPAQHAKAAGNSNSPIPTATAPVLDSTATQLRNSLVGLIETKRSASCFSGKRRQTSWRHSRSTRLNDRLPGLHARLSSEAEREYACRAGTTAATWAGDLQDETTAAALEPIAWYWNNSDQQTLPVRGKAANPWGLYDLLGNVWEWCQDWYGRYHAVDAADPTGPDVGSYRVLRGGSWGSSARGVRAANRRRYPPDYRNDRLGFRLSRGQGPE
jgi:hypothetical protein